MVKETIPVLKAKLKVFGAKLSGNKAVLKERVQNWTENKLNRTLFTVQTIPAADCNPFPKVSYQPIEKLPSKLIHWFTKSAIDLYFSERMANKGNDKGRRLFMRNFLKNCRFHKEGNNIFVIATCCSQMKKSVEYEVNVHTDSHECSIMKSQCQCPAGVFPSAACKHVSALLYAIEYYAVAGKVKQIPTCTSSPQQWHKPKTSKGRNIQTCSVDDLVKVSPQLVKPIEVLQVLIIQ